MGSARLSHLRALFLGGLLCLLVSGCPTKLTKENMEKVKDGMSEAEVFAILGKGEVVTPNSDFSQVPDMARGSIQSMVATGTCYRWKNGRLIMVVRFVNGKVTGRFTGSFN